MIILIHWLFKSLFLIHRHAGGQVDPGRPAATPRNPGSSSWCSWRRRVRSPPPSGVPRTVHVSRVPTFLQSYLCEIPAPPARAQLAGGIPGCPSGRPVYVPDGWGVASSPAASRSGVNPFHPLPPYCYIYCFLRKYPGQLYLCKPVPRHIPPDHAQDVRTPLQLGQDTALVIHPF